MSISIEELGPGPAKGVLLLAVASAARRVEGALWFLMTNPQTPEFVALEKLSAEETAAIDAWLSRRFPRSEFRPAESRRTVVAGDE